MRRMDQHSTNYIIEELKKRLLNPLPGWKSHSLMATQIHKNARAIPRPNARIAGVLMLLFPKNKELHLPLILRPTYEGVHSGQMALPGGKVEPYDQDIIHTALRETEEEIGVKVERQQVLGKLSDLYIPPSNIIVTPVVAFCEQEPTYILDPAEVADIVDFSISELRDLQNQMVTQVRVVGGVMLDVPAFSIQGRIVWGATAMMLSELLDVLNEIS